MKSDEIHDGLLIFHLFVDSLEELNSGSRGGVQLVTDRRAGVSRLLVSKATWQDAGNYTCEPDYSSPDYVTVHVLQGKCKQWLFVVKQGLTTFVFNFSSYFLVIRTLFWSVSLRR